MRRIVQALQEALCGRGRMRPVANVYGAWVILEKCAPVFEALIVEYTYGNRNP
jgi:hypothetical protein